MAVLVNGILGNISGKIAHINGYTLNGKGVIRCPNTKRNDAKSEAQLLVRSKFKYVNAFQQPLYYNLLQETLGLTEGIQTPYFKWTALNHSFFDANGLIGMPPFVISKGLLLPAASFAITGVNSHSSIQCYWDNNSNGINAFESDIFKGFLYNYSTRSIQVIKEQYRRDAISPIFLTGGGWSSRTFIAIYGSFVSVIKSSISDTRYDIV